MTEEARDISNPKNININKPQILRKMESEETFLIHNKNTSIYFKNIFYNQLKITNTHI